MQSVGSNSYSCTHLALTLEVVPRALAIRLSRAKALFKVPIVNTHLCIE